MKRNLIHYLKIKNVNKESHIVSLNPTLDNHSLIRVGGRVKSSEIFACSNNQIIICKDHQVAKLIVQHFNTYNLHVVRYLHVEELFEKQSDYVYIVKDKEVNQYTQ